MLARKRKWDFSWWISSIFLLAIWIIGDLIFKEFIACNLPFYVPKFNESKLINTHVNSSLWFIHRKKTFISRVDTLFLFFLFYPFFPFFIFFFFFGPKFENFFLFFLFSKSKILSENFLFFSFFSFLSFLKNKKILPFFSLSDQIFDTICYIDPFVFGSGV